MKTKVFKKGRLTVKFLDNPHTPCMVYIGESSGTLWCVAETGEVDFGKYNLTAEEIEWLYTLYDEADEWETKVKIMPEWA